MSEWKPIESAPKCGLILLAVEDESGERNTFVAEATYNSEKNCWSFEVTTGWAGWQSLHSAWRPTHWMPLPKPPQETRG